MKEKSSQTIKEFSEDKEIKNSSELKNDSVSKNKEDFTNFALTLDLKMNTLKKKLFSSNEEKIEE